MSELSFKQRTTIVTLVNFTLILGFFVSRIRMLIQDNMFIESKVFTLYGIVIFCAVVVSILAIVITNFGPQIMRAIKEGDENPEFDDFEDERDNLIDLQGTHTTHTITSFGTLIAMLTYVFGQPPLVMFTLMILSGLIGQIVGDVRRIALYRRGF